jgi:Flp pilus assembly pilin Flp
MWVLAKEFVASEEGVSLIEYSLLVGLMSVAIVFSVSAISGSLATFWSTAANAMAAAA